MPAARSVKPRSERGQTQANRSSSWIIAWRRLALYLRSDFRCAYCGKDLRGLPARMMGLDHLENLVAGGGHKGADNRNENLVMACASCNSARCNKPWREYATGGAIERIEALRLLPINAPLAKALIASGQKWSDR